MTDGEEKHVAFVCIQTAPRRKQEAAILFPQNFWIQ